jgi:O-antigen/teichoic acid export membrane protein
MWQATTWLTAVMGVFFIVIAATSAWLVPAIYGPKFVGTQHALIVLTLAQVVAGASLPAARALFVMQRPDQVFASHLAGIVVNLGLGLPMVYSWGIVGAAYATLIGAVLKAGLGGYWYFAQVRGQVTAAESVKLVPSVCELHEPGDGAKSRRPRLVSSLPAVAAEEAS